jgi:HEAT repeat protein
LLALARIASHWAEQTHNAVREGIANYLPFLSSRDPQLCVAALCLLGCFKEESAQIVPHLQTLLETTRDKSIRAFILHCLGGLLTATDEATRLLIPYLNSDQPEGVRLSAAIALCAAMREHISEDML